MMCEPLTDAELKRKLEEFVDKYHAVDEDEGQYQELLERLAVAQGKHPVYAEGIWQGMGRIGEEYGELCQSVNHGESEERIMSEAWDLLCVVWRFVRGDWRGYDE